MRKLLIYLPLFFPAYLIKLQIAGIPFTVIELLVYFSFLFFLPQLIKTFFDWFRKNSVTDQLNIYIRSIYFPTSLILIGAAIPIFFLPTSTIMIDGSTSFENQRIALGIWKGWIVSPILYFTLLLNFLKKESEIKETFRAFIFAAALLSIHGVYQLISGNFITADQRASGPFISANYLSLFIGPAFVYLLLSTIKPLFNSESTWEKIKKILARLFTSRKNHQKKTASNFIKYGCIVLILTALLGSQSYGVVISIIFTLGLYLAIQSWRFHKNKTFTSIIKIAGIIFAFAAASLIFFIFINPDKVQELFIFHERTSSAVRIEVWTIAANLIKNHFFLGIGPGQFEAFYQLNATDILQHPPYEWIMLHPHNIFLTFWLYSGILGLLGFIWIIIRTFKTLIQKKHQPTALIIAMMMVTILVHGIVDTPFWKNDLALIFWLIIGGFEVLTRNTKTQ